MYSTLLAFWKHILVNVKIFTTGSSKLTGYAFIRAVHNDVMSPLATKGG